jgi:hypothetical protein
MILKSDHSAPVARALRSRLLALTLGAVFCLIVFEAALRVIGYLELRGARPPAPPDDGKFRITCIGNSYTYGSGAPRGMSYPEQLERLLDTAAPGRYQVTNRGLPNVNSSFIAENLPRWLDRDRPHIVFAMVGEPNMWNKYGYQDYRRAISKFEAGPAALLGPLRSLRLVQLAELFLNRPETWNRPDAEVYSTMFPSRRKDTAEAKLRLAYLWIGALETSYFRIRQLSPEAHREAVDVFRFLLRREPGNAIAARMLADLLRRSAASQPREFTEAIFAATALQADRFNFPLWRVLRDLRPELFDDRLSKLKTSLEARVSKKKLAAIQAFFRKPSLSHSGAAAETLFKMLEYHPTHPEVLKQLAQVAGPADFPRLTRSIVRSLELNPLQPSVYYVNIFRRRIPDRSDLLALIEDQFRRNAAKFGDDDPSTYWKDDRLDEGWILHDLDRIVDLVRSRGARVVVQNYPPPREGGGRQIDAILRNWWARRRDRRGIEFLDVTNRLAELYVRVGKKEPYYSFEAGPTDQHLNALGYGEVAKLMQPLVPRFPSAELSKNGDRK